MRRFINHRAVHTAVGILGLMGSTASAQAAGNVVLALDGMIVNNSGGGQGGWGGFGRFNYGDTFSVGTSSTLGRYDSFTISETGGATSAGGGVGVNFAIGAPAADSPRDFATGPVNPVTSAMFPLLDRGAFGINLDPNQYVAELIYKPLPGNTATQLNVTLDTHDGFTAAGLRAGEQVQWGFFDLVNTYNNTQANGDLDADGFARSLSNMGVLSQAALNFTGQSFMFSANVNNTTPASNPTGDAAADLNDFEGIGAGALAAPNGAVQIHLQAVFGGTQQPLVDNWEIKALRIVKINPDPAQIARLDAKSGISLRFGTPFERNPGTPINVGGVDYDPVNTDQVSRFNAAGFTNLVINTDDDGGTGGIAMWQPAATQTFDGTTAAIEIRAKLTAPLAGQADHVTLIAKDKDGSGTANTGDFGGEEYHFNVPLGSFNEAGMVTLSIPFTAATMLQAQEFATPGDALLTNFNLYSLGLQTDAGAGLVDLEVEFIDVVVPPPRAGDYDYDNDVDGNDFLVWQRSLGSSVATFGTRADGNGNGVVDGADLATWQNNFATAVGAGTGVPEPAAAALVAVACMGAGVSRRRCDRTRCNR
jgi:hypothetical protein